MKVHIITPYSTEKNLGKAYNDAVSLLPDGDWACVTDYDTMFLTPDCGKILHDYVNLYPETGIFTCLTNRIHPLAHFQLLNGVVSDNPNIREHVRIANEQKKALYQVKEVKTQISGFLMMFSRETWVKNPFPENGKCLGVDNFFSKSVLDSGKTIQVMQGLYVFHLYRIFDIKDKSHLL